MAIIEPTDLEGLMPSGWTPQQVQAEIDDALAWARFYVPCLDNLPVGDVAAVKAVLRKAVPYNAKAASSTGGEVRTVNAGPLGFTTEQRAPRESGAYFSPTQIKALESLCQSRGRRFGTIMTRPL
ncbi:MAG TPA: hypothetical protein VGF17_10015 [Phytomonospora sp.]